ncbi:linear amide C-N hydrolase [Pseudofrancisella aestuarii]|uniref:Linear amide C-N hydrolase n=1 Tax=Pseudofrancisella aestuarii TaxID=2670347 RepID=A0ABV9T9X7_9GAMM|nr:linear amide C-N hydrolase [Pseudofrancisella aestuarii]
MCTRVLYQGSEDLVITARSMDWIDDMNTSLVILPPDTKYISSLGDNPLSWTSKYGSVSTFVYNIGSADGMNEKGLVANLLYLAESEYGHNSEAKDLSILQWLQLSLDLFATVAEAVDFFQSNKINIITGSLPNGKAGSVHLSLSDASGDSAIFEYIDGKLCIHHSREYTVMTNSPRYEEQLALCRYWKNINGTTFLPGSVSAADRFVRASFFLNAIPKTIAPNYITLVPGQLYHRQALASMFGVIRAVGVPLGIHDPEKPNLSSTIYRTVSDHKNLVYYFESATVPSAFWVKLNNINFDKINSPLILENAQNLIHSGEVPLEQFIDYKYPTAEEVRKVISL